MVFGNVLQTSADAIYLARHVGLRSGLPIETPAVTVNRLCGSGFEAVAQAAQQIVLGESEAVLAGGTESMSQAPHVVRGARWGLRLGPAAPLEDSSLGGAARPQLRALHGGDRRKPGREVSDQPAGGGLLRRPEPGAAAAAAWQSGAFADEVVPVPIPNRKTKQADDWAADEHMRPGTTPRGPGQVAPLLQEGWGGDGRQRLGYL